MGQNFYLDIRRTLLHPWCVATKDKGTSKETTKKIEGKTYVEYLAEPSGKLDHLVAILRYHLAEDGAPGLSQEGISELLRPSQREGPYGPPPPRPSPDKIIVFSYFPSSFWLIKLVRARPSKSCERRY